MWKPECQCGACQMLRDLGEISPTVPSPQQEQSIQDPSVYEVINPYTGEQHVMSIPEEDLKVEDTDCYGIDYPDTQRKPDPKIVGNPKALAGRVKTPLGLIPPVAMLHCADAMRDGAEKYGAWNFREVDISAQVYVNAAMRHLLAWFCGEQCASDSKVHHLGHAMACCALMIDSEHIGNLIDDRPIDPQFAELMKQLAERTMNAKEKSSN